jgi:hypothetical protein
MWWVLAAIAAMRQHVNKPLPVVPARQTKRFQANRAERKLIESKAHEADASVADYLRTGAGLEGAPPAGRLSRIRRGRSCAASG